MSERKPAKKKTFPLIERDATDSNFPHTVRMMGALTSWAESLPIGHKFQGNDLNMVHIPVEIAWAFVKLHAVDENDLGAACRGAIELRQQFKAAFAHVEGETSDLGG